MFQFIYQSTIFQTIVIGIFVLGALKLLKPTSIYNHDGSYKSPFVTPEIIAIVSAALFYIVKSWLFTNNSTSIRENIHVKPEHVNRSRHKMRYGKEEFMSNNMGDEILRPEEYYN